MPEVKGNLSATPLPTSPCTSSEDSLCFGAFDVFYRNFNVIKRTICNFTLSHDMRGRGGEGG